MDFRQLTYFVKAVEHGDYALAAKELFVTPQAISKSVRNLEKELNISLTFKRGRRMVFTDFAYELAARAETALDAMRDFETFARNSAGDDSESIFHLGVAGFHHRGFILKEELAGFAVEHPAVRLSVMRYPSETCIMALTSGVFDAIVVPGGCDDVPFVSQELFREPLFFATYADDSDDIDGGVFDISMLKGCRVACPIDLHYSLPTLERLAKGDNVEFALVPVDSSSVSHVCFLESEGVIPVFESCDLPDYCSSVVVRRAYAGGRPVLIPFHYVRLRSSGRRLHDLLINHLIHLD